MILDDCCLRYLLQRLSSIDVSVNNVYLSPDVSTGETDLFALGNGNTYDNVYLALETRLMLKTIHDVSLGNRKIQTQLINVYRKETKNWLKVLIIILSIHCNIELIRLAFKYLQIFECKEINL